MGRRCLLRRCWTSRQDRDGGSSHGQRQGTPMRTLRSCLFCHFTFPSILAQCGTKPPLYWMWMRLFTGSSLGGYARASFRCRVELVDLVELIRLHTGRECCPEVPRTAARALAEDPEMVRPQSVAPRVVRRLLFGLAVSGPAGGGRAWFGGTNVRPRSGANGRTGIPFQVV
ncbi:hypothetical protein C3747_2g154 [Trypanosoma cruzi]|uniref:Uncharacterized protein n=1 Tax=Trypanosoma cruzi TaxID=5693 RepID=A0A2V2XLT5_TRYCR|nr:hypothetical protein C3747_2g154 [Trypanosoma cruzi]